jgi:glyoxylase-like metal-dependent hydrolase (beta-lactamase superfamily II)
MRLHILTLICAAVALAQRPPAPPLVPENQTIKVTDHVWVIPDGRVNLVPNIGIIAGSRATLVVDGGMGQRNGQVVLSEMRKVSKNNLIYLTTTHFHPEHVTGFQAFPPSAVLIRPAVQQTELVAGIGSMITNFSKMSPVHADLLKDVKLRSPDVLFDSSVEFDLGGITARLFTLGPTHTRGDNFVLVKADGQAILFTGDVVTNRFFPIMTANGKNWISVLDQLAALKPNQVVPGHGEMDDVGVIAREHTMLTELQARVRELKGQGKSTDETAKTISSEFKAKYPAWENPEWLASEAKTFYGETE